MGQQAEAEHARLDLASWPEVALHLYGFDRRTAERLAFVRWLWETHRLTED
jgi:hypothetical protein